MKLLSFHATDGVRLGVRTDAGVVDVRRAAEAAGLPAPLSMREAIAGGATATEHLQRLLTQDPVEPVPEHEVRFAPAVPDPDKIICVGANYLKHAKEAGIPIPEVPIYFPKYENSLSAHREEVALPDVTQRGDYEVELVAVIGRETRNVDRGGALDRVFGYATGNDLSARELQQRSSQWMYGKAIDGFAPLGPYVVTADEVPDPQALDLQCWVNGELRQSSNTRDMIFTVADLVADLSRIMTLKPGDLIYTGTPEGVALGMAEPKWLQVGDEVACEVQGLGRLVTYLVADKESE
ncbi:MAG: fumarylacetoacetate hydrolase family protein [Actinomycetota bacterium]|nr:fumarylacetoacetate hydrolase family protein [Actinomycetota bacterium]